MYEYEMRHNCIESSNFSKIQPVFLHQAVVYLHRRCSLPCQRLLRCMHRLNEYPAYLHPEIQLISPNTEPLLPLYRQIAPTEYVCFGFVASKVGYPQLVPSHTFLYNSLNIPYFVFLVLIADFLLHISCVVLVLT